MTRRQEKQQLLSQYTLRCQALSATVTSEKAVYEFDGVTQEEGTAMPNEVEALGMRLLRAFDEEAIDNPRTAVLAEDAARRAGFDYGTAPQTSTQR